MAGVKGRSGGARPNSGPKPKRVKPLAANAEDPLDFLLQVMRDKHADPAMRVRAAISASQYVHSKKGEGGVLVGRKKAAKAASHGKYAPATPPKLVIDNS